MAEKKIFTNTFEEGINTVIADELLPQKQARYILNCNILSSAAGNVGVITNVKGNRLIPVELPEGDNRVIGYTNDEEENNMYYAVWNANGYHTWYRFNVVERNVTRIFQDITDTAGVQIFNWTRDNFILHIDIVANNLLYWTVKGDIARKINISKCLDKTNTGYGSTILEEYTRAYKKPPGFAPTVNYTTDLDKPFNRVYGFQFKFCTRFVYDDNEKSNYSDFSDVAKPDKELFTGMDTIPSNNNCIVVGVPTGLPTVKQIEIAMMQTNPEGGTLDWVTIAVLDKEKLGISSNSTYEYNFYNDGSYSNAVQSVVNRPYSFLPKEPLCQAFVKNAMVYANFKEGFPDVPIDASVTVNYDDLTIDDGVINEENNPSFTVVKGVSDYIESKSSVTYYNGSGVTVYRGARFSRFTISIGGDVKKDNMFSVTFADAGNNVWVIEYKANLNDSAETVYHALRQKLINTGVIFRKVPEIEESNIYNWNPSGGGGGSFSFIMRGFEDYPRIVSQYVRASQYSSLKDTGQSINNIKMGSTGKVGFMYEDKEGNRKSLVYTNENLVYKVDPVNGHLKIKQVSLNVSINHQAPEWAEYYQVILSKDLTYDNYIQMLIQKAIDVQATENTEFLDLSVGSLFTYQKLRDNVTLRYDFKKGDRLRLIKKINTSTSEATFYPFFETEIISYKDVVIQEKNENITVNGTNTVTVENASDDNKGSYLRVNGVERLITGSPSATQYTLSNNITLDQDGSASKTFPYYEIINRNAVIRIKKPADITIEDNSIVEVYSPSLKLYGEDGKNFFELGYKFGIIRDGNGNLLHAGNQQDQTNLQPAIVKVTKGTAYVRNRELPANNITPNTQVVITQVEDPSFSDFYVSNLNDLGRPNAEDIGTGEIHFGNRFRFSNNFIEDTKINGLNDFNNLDREDYYDKYGDVMRILLHKKRLVVYKYLSTAWIPVSETIISDESGQQLVATSNKLLGNIQYFAWDGGIGNNPEAVAVNGTHLYHASANSGVIIRLSLDGETPISQIYYLDNEFVKLLSDAQKNGSKIHLEFEKFTGNLVVSIEGSPNYIYVNMFDEANWQPFDNLPPEETEYTILTGPFNGTLDLTDPKFPVYTPDTDYTGTDYFTYSAVINGQTIEKKVCINVIEQAPQYIWRVKESSAYCVQEGGNNTGYKGWYKLEKYDIVNGVVSGEEMDNTPDNPFYVAPVYNVVSCPLPEINIYANITPGTTTGVYYKVNSETGNKAITNLTPNHPSTSGLRGVKIPSLVGIEKNIQLDRTESLVDPVPYGAIMVKIGQEIADVKWSNRDYLSNSFVVTNGMEYDFMCHSFVVDDTRMDLLNVSNTNTFSLFHVPSGVFIKEMPPLSQINTNSDTTSVDIKNEMSYPVKFVFIWVDCNDPNINTDDASNIQVKIVDFAANERKIVSPDISISGDFALFVILSDKLEADPTPPENTVEVVNSKPFATIESVTGIPGFSLPEPLDNTESYISTFDNPFTGVIDVKVFITGGECYLTMYVNNVYAQQIEVTDAEDDYSFDNYEFNEGDYIFIELT